MAKCAYCNKLKGKRSCPALGGVIDSRCCGQHRLREIDCPMDCVYLGGSGPLKLWEEGEKSAAALTALATERGLRSGSEKVVTFALSAGRREGARDAFQRFFQDDEQPDPRFEPAFVGWFVHGFVPEGEEAPVLEQYLRERGPKMGREETASLAALERGYFSIFNIESIDVEAGTFKLRDTLGEIFELSEEQAVVDAKDPEGAALYDTEELGTLCCAWLLELNDGHWLAGTPIPLPEMPDYFLPALQDDLEGWQKSAEGLAPRKVLSRHVDEVFAYVLQVAEKPSEDEEAQA